MDSIKAYKSQDAANRGDTALTSVIVDEVRRAVLSVFPQQHNDQPHLHPDGLHTSFAFSPADIHAGKEPYLKLLSAKSDEDLLNAILAVRDHLSHSGRIQDAHQNDFDTPLVLALRFMSEAYSQRLIQQASTCIFGASRPNPDCVRQGPSLFGQKETPST